MRERQPLEAAGMRGPADLRPRAVVVALVAAAIAAASAAALSGAPSPQAPSPSARARAAERAGERIGALLREAEELAVQQSRLLVELRTLESDRQARAADLARIERELRGTELALSEASARTATLGTSTDTQRPAVERTLVRIYKMGPASHWRLLLDVEDLRNVGRAYRTASALTHLDQTRVLTYQRTLESLVEERRKLQDRATRLGALQQEASAARVALDRAVAAHTARIDEIDRRRDLNAQLAGELQEAQRRLQASLAGAESAGGVSVALPLGAFRGALPWPARGRLLTPFGRQTSSRFGTAVVRNGVELEVRDGQTITAVHEGTVAYADQFTGYGTLVIVEHGAGAFSLYGHLGAVTVSRGQPVEAGTPVGTSGRNPSGNPALYFELRVDGRPVDPLQWLQKGPQ